MTPRLPLLAQPLAWFRRRPTSASRGFSVLELLLAVLVFGTLAALATIKFGEAKKKAYIDAMMNDLHNYALAEEIYADATSGFGTVAQVKARQQFAFSRDVIAPDSEAVDPTYWYLRVGHKKTDAKCWLLMQRGQQWNTSQRIQCDGQPVAAASSGPGAPTVDFGVDTVAGGNAATLTFSYAKRVYLTANVTDPNGEAITNYVWALSTGATLIGDTASFTVTAPGTVTVTLTATDAKGQSGSLSRTISFVNLPPVAQVQVTTSAPAAKVVAPAAKRASGPTGVAAKAGATAGLSAQSTAPVLSAATTVQVPDSTLLFDATGSHDPDGTITDYQFDYGDWTYDVGPRKTKQFAAPGTYNVTLIVRDNFSAVDTAKLSVSVDSVPGVITPSFTWTPSNPTTITNITFDGSASSSTGGRIIAYQWDWGDWTTSGQGAQTSHRFRAVDDTLGYLVQLTVVDARGKFASDTQRVKVGLASDVVQAGLRNFWDPCQGIGGQSLIDTKSGVNLQNGSAATADPNDLTWDYQPNLASGPAPTPLWKSTNGGTAEYGTLASGFTTGADSSHTWVVSYASWSAPASTAYLFSFGSFAAYLGNNGSVGVLYPGSGGAQIVGAGGVSFDGALHTLAFVFDANKDSVLYYRDGTRIAGIAASFGKGTLTGAVSISKSANDAQGWIGGVLYYNRALPLADVQANHTALVGRRCASANPPAALDITPDTLTLAVGDSGRFTVVAKDSTGALLGDRTVSWESADARIAKINANGVATGVAVGRVWIRAFTETAADSALVLVKQSALPTTRLLAHWSPCTGFGGQTYQDVVGGYNGTLGSTGTADANDPTWVAAIEGTSDRPRPALYSASGSPAQYVTLPASFNPSTPNHTITVRVGGWNGMTGGRVFQSGSGFGIYIQSGASTGYASVVLYLPWASGLTTNTNLRLDGNLHTLTLTYDAVGDSVRVYVDGARNGGAAYTSDGQLGAGGSINYASGEFPGYIGDVLYYDRVLAPSEVLEEHQALTALHCETGSPDGLTVTPNPTQVMVGKTVQLTATPKIGTTPLPDYPVLWESANPGLATVDSTGVVTGVASGSVYVRATAEWVTDSALVAVRDTALVLSGLANHWTPCSGYGGQALKDITGGVDGVLGATSAANETSDPAWVASVPNATGALPRAALSMTYGSPVQYVGVPNTWAPVTTNFSVVMLLGSGWGSSATGRFWQSATGSYYAGANSGGALFFGNPNGSVTTTGWTLPIDGALHTVGFTIDALHDSAFFYIDGVRKAAAKTTAETKPGPGMWLNTTGSEFPGYFSDVLFYTRALSDAEQAQDHLALQRAGCDVSASSIASLTVTPDTVHVAPNVTAQLTVTAKDGSGNTVPAPAVTWSSNGPDRASVSSTGTVTGLTRGSAWVKATLGSLADSAFVIVSDTAVTANGLVARWTLCGVSDPAAQVLPDTAGGYAGIFGLTSTSGEASDPTLDVATHTWAPATNNASKYITLPSVFLRPELQHSVVFVLKTPNGAYGSLFNFSASAFRAIVNGGGSVSIMVPGLSTTITGMTMPQDGAVHVIAFTFDPVAKLVTGYIDGVAKGTAAYNTPQGFMSSTSQLGYSSGSFPGPFGDFLYYARSLSAAEVSAASAALLKNPCWTDVQPAVVDGVTVTPNPITVYVGQTKTASAVRRDTSGAIVSGATFTWASQDTTIATVDATGQIVGKKKGSTWVSATSGGYTGSTLVTVAVAPVVSVRVTPTPVELTVGQYQQFKAEQVDAMGNAVTASNVTWAVSAPSRASIGTTGLLKALDSGTVTVKATVAGLTGTATAIIGYNPATISISPDGATMSVTEGQVFSATVYDDWGKDPYLPVTWTVLGPNLGGLTSTGVQSTRFVAVDTGQFKLVASARGGADTVNVRVLSSDSATLAVDFTITPATLHLNESTTLTPKALKGTFDKVQWSVTASAGAYPPMLPSGQMTWGPVNLMFSYYGTYTFRLTAYETGTSRTTYIEHTVVVDSANKYLPPVAVIQNGDVLPYTPVLFDGTKSYDPNGGTITAYTWDFGDWSSASRDTATHTFQKSGDYAVTLGVFSSEKLSGSTQKLVHVFPSNTQPPVIVVDDGRNDYSPIWVGQPANLWAKATDPDGGYVQHMEFWWQDVPGGGYHYSGLADGYVLYNNPTFKTPGTYSIMYRATDDEGQQTTWNGYIEVRDTSKATSIGTSSFCGGKTEYMGITYCAMANAGLTEEVGVTAYVKDQYGATMSNPIGWILEEQINGQPAHIANTSYKVVILNDHQIAIYVSGPSGKTCTSGTLVVSAVIVNPDTYKWTTGTGLAFQGTKTYLPIGCYMYGSMP